MPIQFSDGGSQIANILGQGGRALLDQANAEIERTRKLNDTAKAADAMVKANPEILQQLGLSPEQWASQGSRDRVAMFGGVIQSQGYRKAQQDMANEKQRGDLLAEQIQGLQQQQSEDTAEGEAVRRYGAGPQGFTLDESSPTPAAAAPDMNGINALLQRNGSMPTTAPPPGLTLDQPPGAAPANLQQMLKPYLSSPPDRLRYALQTPGLGGRGTGRLLESLAALQKIQEASDSEVKAPITSRLPGGYYSYGFPGSKQRGIYPDVTAAPQTFETDAGTILSGPRGQLLQPHAPPNPVANDKMTAETEAIMHKQLQSYNDDLRTFQLNENRVTNGEKNPATGKPYTLMDQGERRKLQKLRDQVEGRLLGPTGAPSPTESAPSQGRVTDIEPPVGTIRTGKGNQRYRYIGGYGQLDKRSWQPIP